MKKLVISVAASLVLIYGWNLEKVSFSSGISAEAKTSLPDFKEIAKKEAQKMYPLSQVLMTQKIWEQQKKGKLQKHYQLTLAEGQQNKQVIAVIHYDLNQKKVVFVQVHEMPLRPPNSFGHLL
ncbi:DUF3889 domain-containing protein [Bacillus mangrovi]|uniref:DUF3889 domain-containing protein n=1 Tax=Metabacillus mangrovi TaxID=1491830 RepID=A0A7X2V4H1_9BACI|nr:DUF3889 domain-containing protein [Metabacillus mangrovi]MTH53385.1 DUF3889 domain-containing protein [Metabacillus mangrovi]